MTVGGWAVFRVEVCHLGQACCFGRPRQLLREKQGWWGSGPRLWGGWGPVGISHQGTSRHRWHSAQGSKAYSSSVHWRDDTANQRSQTWLRASIRNAPAARRPGAWRGATALEPDTSWGCSERPRGHWAGEPRSLPPPHRLGWLQPGGGGALGTSSAWGARGWTWASLPMTVTAKLRVLPRSTLSRAKKRH